MSEAAENCDCSEELPGDIEWEEDSPEVYVENDTVEFEYDEQMKRGKRYNSKIKASRFGKRQKIENAHHIALGRCKEDISMTLVWLKDVTEWTFDELLSSVMHSLLPLDLMDKDAHNSPSSHIQSLFQWFKMAFQTLPNDSMTFEEGRDGSPINDLLDHVISKKVGSLSQICQLWVALLRSFDYKCRLVACFDSISLSPYDYPDLYTVQSIDITNGKSVDQNFLIQNAYRTLNKPKKHLLMWSEVWLNSQPSASSININREYRWVCIHPFLNIFDDPEKIEAIARKGQTINFAISFEVFQTGRSLDWVVMDVTGRYNFKHEKGTKVLAKYRDLCRNWLEDELQNISLQASKMIDRYPKTEVNCDGILCVDLVDDTDTDYVRRSSQIVRREEIEELQRISYENKKHSVPTTFAGFKNHPYYLLERHLLSDEVIHPGKRKNVVGVFKGEAIYLQSAKEKLRTKMQWRKELRNVLPGEIPISSCNRQARKNAPSADGCNRSAEPVGVELKFYGSWQTELYEVRF